MKTKIVCCFPCTGKTRFAYNSSNAIDCRYEEAGTLEEYINMIEFTAGMDKYEYILAASCEEVRKELKKRKLPYIIVTPTFNARDEYMRRELQRNNTMHAIQEMWDTWKVQQESLWRDEAPKIYLKEGEYVSDVLLWRSR